MLAASLGSVAAALGVPAGTVCNTSERVALLRAAMKEVAAVAEATGIGIADSDLDASLDFVRSFPAQVTTSLQRDLELGHKSEYDALTVVVLRIAH
jgi:2-dehydropantoate 2-reductase